jgi:tetratricopeptide (TPR) repeat protein
MIDIARKLISLQGGKREASVPTAILGTASQLAQHLDARPKARIGLWPCISPEAPTLGMGLMAVLGFLLERWRDIRVYRLFAQLEGDPKTYEWTVSQSQFSVEDWGLDQLDENAALWGKLESVGDQWRLTFQLENDLLDGEERTFEYQVEDAAGLVNTLLDAAEEIATQFDVGEPIGSAYSRAEASDSSLRVLLGDLFEWHVRLLLSQWGKPWPEFEIRSALAKLMDSGQAVGGDFGAWCVTNMTAHAMLPGYESVAESVASNAAAVAERFSYTSFPAIFISTSLYRMEYVQQAYDLLENEVETHPDNVASWLALGELYRSGGRMPEAIDAFQRAIEAEATNTALYLRYAALLSALNAENRDVEEFILIDPDDYSDNFLTWEAVEAYEQALRLSPERGDVLGQQILLLMDLQSMSRLWEQFTRLVNLDNDGETVRSVVDALYNVEDVEPAVEIIKRQIDREPERYDLYVNLAVVYLTAEQEDLAAEALEAAEDLTDDAEILADIDRLMLSADDPEFEARLGELVGITNAGNALSTDAVKFLEESIEAVPTLAEAYVALAKAYAAWEEDETALETLLDGHKHVPEDPDIIEMLVQMLWDSGENALAFEYLNKGLAANPNHVPLLALAGECLFEDGQHDEAKAYLARAEAIAPRHPALARARLNIAQSLQRDD